MLGTGLAEGATLDTLITIVNATQVRNYVTHGFERAACNTNPRKGGGVRASMLSDRECMDDHPHGRQVD